MKQKLHPRKSGPGGVRCLGQLGEGMTIFSKPVALGGAGGCNFPAATAATAVLALPLASEAFFPLAFLAVPVSLALGASETPTSRSLLLFE